MTGRPEGQSWVGREVQESKIGQLKREGERDKSLDIKATCASRAHALGLGGISVDSPTVDAWVDLYRGSWPWIG